ncbi:hypothetical protein MKW92_032405 [Papaver armeniacum]|nr:hypothetical protein MKW92_032405 [Papaver armeniacum]
MTRKSTRVKPPMKQQVATKAAPHKPARSTGGVTKPCRYRRPGIAAPHMCNIMEHGAKVSCHSRPNCIKDYTRELDGIYLKLLEESCFGHLIHLPSLSFCSNVVHNVLLRRKDTPKKDKEEDEEDAMSFIIGNQVMCFGEREFAMMSGLKFQGTHFPGQDNVKLGDLVEKFYQLQNSEDKLKLGLLSIAEGVIMGHGLYKNEFNNYPWGKLSYKATISSLISAWIFHSIPSLKENYTVENKDFSQTLYPRILHLEVPRIQVTLHKKIWKELSRLDIKVLSPLHPTQEELKECYMAGLLSEGEDSGVRGHESDSGIKELNVIACSFLFTINHDSNKRICLDQQKKKQIINLKSNSQLLKKVDKKIGTNTKEYITLSNDEDEDVESLENLKLKLGSEIEILKKERSAVESDVGLLNKKMEEMETHHYKFLEEKAILIKERLELRRDIESLNKEKTKLSTDTDLLNKEKEKLECDFGILNKQHQKLQFDFEILNKEKTKLGNDVELLSRYKSEMETGYEFLKDEKNKLATDLEFTNKEKDKLRNDVELLNEEKGKLLSDVEFLNEEKAKLGDHTELLSKEKTKLQSDFECLNRKKKITVQEDICLLNEKKTTVHGDICSLNENKTTLESEIKSLSNEKSNLENETDLLGKEKTKLQSDKDRLQIEIELLSNEKTNLGKETDLLTKNKTKLECDFEILYKESTTVKSDVELIYKKKTKLGNDIELLTREKSEMETGFEFLKREKSTVQDDVCSLNEKKTSIQDDILLAK